MTSPRTSSIAVRCPLVALLVLSMIGGATAQTPPGEMPAASTPMKTTKSADLTNRYRFSELFAPESDKANPSIIGPSRVGIIEVARDLVDTPQGAPRRTEATRQTIFLERAAEINGMGGVSSSIRTFERFRARPEDPARMMGAQPLEGLAVLVRPKSGESPLILSLDDGRSLTDYEFEVIAHLSFVPGLGLILPSRSVRLDDTWRIPRKAAQAMLGEPAVQGDTLIGKLVELRKEVEGPRMVARITVSGKSPGTSGDVVVNAEALFTFWPEAPRKDASDEPTFPPRPAADVIEARGAVTELRLARRTTAQLPGRLQFRSNREIILHRQLGVADAGAPRPQALPGPTEANSWLTYLEPSNRFSIQHPQDLLPPHRGPVAPLEPNAVAMVRTLREGVDHLQVEYVPRTLTPEDLKQKMDARRAAFKLDFIPGDEAWLPEADWPNMRVHRIEAALKAAPGPRAGAPGDSSSPRLHFDGYLVQFGQSASILAVATTSRDAVASYRREIEQILKTIRIAPPAPR